MFTLIVIDVLYVELIRVDIFKQDFLNNYYNIKN